MTITTYERKYVKLKHLVFIGDGDAVIDDDAEHNTGAVILSSEYFRGIGVPPLRYGDATAIGATVYGLVDGVAEGVPYTDAYVDDSTSAEMVLYDPLTMVAADTWLVTIEPGTVELPTPGQLLIVPAADYTVATPAGTYRFALRHTLTAGPATFTHTIFEGYIEILPGVPSEA